MRLVALVAALSVGLFACDGDAWNRWSLEERLVQRFPRLPKMFSAVVALRTGGYASLLVEFRRPGSLEQVRIFPGILASGPGWVSSMSVELSMADGGAIEWLVHRTDLLTKERQTSSFDTPVRFRSLDREHLTLQTESSTESLVLVPRDAEPRQWDGSDLRDVYHREGPGEGFQARLQEDRLELRLPRGDTRGWQPVMQGVTGILGAWWLASDELTAEQSTILQDRFKQMGVLTAERAHAEIDGDLGDWEGALALPVDQRGQVLRGAEYWEGARDGSFGVVARVSLRSIFLAIRVRDDELLPGRDKIRVQLGHRKLTWPLSATASELDGRGWRLTMVEPRELGTGLEAWLDPGQLHPDRLALPISVQFEDHDSGQGSTWIGTASSPSLVGVGYAKPQDEDREP